MEVGCAVSAGSSRSSAASTASRSSSKKEESFIAAGNPSVGSNDDTSRFTLPFGIEGFGGKLAIGLLEEDFHTAFRLFQLLLAFTRKRNAFFEEFHRFIQRELRAFQTPHNFFETRKRALEIRLLRRLRLFGCR